MMATGINERIRDELYAGAIADESEFVFLDAEAVIAKAKRRHAAREGQHEKIDIPARLKDGSDSAD